MKRDVLTKPGDYSAVFYDARRNLWLLFPCPVAVHVAHRLSEVLPALAAVEHDTVRGGYWAAGYLTYEASPAFDPALTARPPGTLPLLWFGIYEEPLIIAPPVPDSGSRMELDWKATLTRREYEQALERIKTYIHRGETYQVNYTFRLCAAFSNNPWQLFAQLIAAQYPKYGAFLNTPDWALCCASPELFFRQEDDEIISRPMKGTMPRGLWYEDDLEKAQRLRRSQKERAENVMIVDMVRNDLGRIAEVGSVQVVNLFEVEQYPTLWQMTSTVRCKSRAPMPRLFEALFPAASITGAPKPRTMQLISHLENTPREIYTGTMGFISPHRRAQFNVAIRTVMVDKRSGSAQYGVGGGIVWDSKPASEYEECRTKALILTRSTPEFSLLETLLWTPEEGFFLLEEHLLRLNHSVLYFAFAADMGTLRRLLMDSTSTLSPVPHKIRLLVSRPGAATVECSPVSFPKHPFTVRLAKQPVDASNPFLYHKTTRREVYLQARQDFPDYEDVLLWNQKGELTESCIANLIVEIQGEWFTPPTACGLLPGIYRSHLLRQGKVTERVIHLEELKTCSRIFLINSVRGQWECRWLPEDLT